MVNAPSPILEIIAAYALRPFIRNSNPRWRYQMQCPLPGHSDSASDGGSFYVDETQQLFRCFGCDAKGNAFQLQQLLEGQEHLVQFAVRAKEQPRNLRSKLEKAEPLQGVTIDQLAHAKSLDGDYLRGLGWRDTFYLNVPAIKIPYYDQDGTSPLIRYRVGLDTGDRFRWEKFSPGQRLRPYGLWNIKWIRQQGYCFLVEGETDYAAISQRGVAVLGIPGASSYRSQWTPWLAGLCLCAWQEPGEGGQKFVQKLLNEFQSLEVIEAPDFAKDPCALLGVL